MDKEAKLCLDDLMDQYFDSMILLKQQHPELTFTQIAEQLNMK